MIFGALVPVLLGASLAAAVPSPSPSPTPSDPCGSLLSIVNRPTVTTGVCTVRTGHFDVENGYTNATTNGPNGGSTVDFPQSLIRVGTADPHLDFELGAPSYEATSVGAPRTTGSGDLSVGAKYELGYDAKADWGLSAEITYPTGSTAFSAGNAQFVGDLNAGYTIDPEFALAGTLGFNALSAPNAAGTARSYFAFIPSLELSAALPGGPSEISLEYAYFSAAGPDAGAKSLVDLVYERDFGAHLQVDAEYGVSPTPVAGQSQHYVGAGLSFMN